MVVNVDLKMINLNKHSNSLINLIILFSKKLKSKFFPSLIEKEAIKWNIDGGDFELRFNYPLNDNSIVFDLGGFKGNFASDLFARMPCNFYVFEPVKQNYLIIKKRFRFNNMIEVFPFGLSNKTESTLIEIKGAGSSTFINDIDNKATNPREKVELVDIVEFINQKNISEIDLMKINIEGGEYDVLERLLDEDKVRNIKYLQIQFHILDKNSTQKKDNIRKLLQKTHNCEYCYEFVWENWIRKDI